MASEAVKPRSKANSQLGLGVVGGESALRFTASPSCHQVAGGLGSFECTRPGNAMIFDIGNMIITTIADVNSEVGRTTTRSPWSDSKELLQ